MPYLVAAVVLVGLLCVVNLWFTMAVVRRLREHTRLLSEVGSGTGGRLEPTVDRVPAFTASTVDGQVVTGPNAGLAVVAFLATDCAACDTQLPGLLRYLSEERHDPERVLAVVAGVDTPKGERMVETLRTVASVVREPLDGAVCTAFAATRFPTFYLVEGDGDVRVGAGVADALPRRVRT